MDASTPKLLFNGSLRWTRTHRLLLSVLAALLLLYAGVGFLLLPRVALNAIIQYV